VAASRAGWSGGGTGGVSRGGVVDVSDEDTEGLLHGLAAQPLVHGVVGLGVGEARVDMDGVGLDARLLLHLA
jgi:hypothetical protein